MTLGLLLDAADYVRMLGLTAGNKRNEEDVRAS